MSGIPASTLNFSVNMLGVDVALQWMGQLKDAFGGAASAAVDTYAQTELLQLSYKALAAQEMMSLDPSLSKRDAMRQGADAARDLYEYTQRMAIQSPFTSEDIAQAAKIGMAYAFLATQVTDVEEAQQKNLMTTQRVVQAQLDFAAGTGNASSVIAELTSILGKAQATGTLLSEDFAMLSDRSLPVLEVLAKHYGVTTQEIIKMRGESKITADEAIDAIVRWQEAIHGGAAEAMGGTMSGLQASLEELRGNLMREAATPVIEGTVQPAMKTMVDLMRRPEVLQAARDVGALSQELVEGVVPALQGATTAWIAYHAASNIGHIQALGGWSRAAAAGLNPLSAGLSSVGHGLSNVASRAAQVPANLLTMGSAVTGIGAATAAIISLNQELDRLAEHKATSALEQTSGWQQAQDAIEQYKLASPEVRAELQHEKAALDALMASMEARAITDAEMATKNVSQSEAEKTRILINNYQYYADTVGSAAQNLSTLVDAETEAVQIHDTRIAHLKDLVEMQEQVVDIQLSGLKAARDQERDQLQSQEDLVAQYWERRGAITDTSWQAHANAQSQWDQALMDEFLTHHNNLSAAEQERLLQRGAWNQALAAIEETRIDSRVAAQDTYRNRLLEIDEGYARSVEAAEVQLTETLADCAWSQDS